MILLYDSYTLGDTNRAVTRLHGLEKIIWNLFIYLLILKAPPILRCCSKTTWLLISKSTLFAKNRHRRSEICMCWNLPTTIKYIYFIFSRCHSIISACIIPTMKASSCYWNVSQVICTRRRRRRRGVLLCRSRSARSWNPQSNDCEWMKFLLFLSGFVRLLPRLYTIVITRSVELTVPR